MGETTLAELIISRVAGIEKVRFTSTGTEATMTAIRLARGVTGRDLIIKFAGCYHGHSDGLLAQAGSGVATAGLPGSAGVTAGAAQDTIVLPYNDLEAVREVFDSRGEDIAAVIIEAASANMGVVPPDPGFNQGLREITRAQGALLIQDEVLTGFRVSDSGWWGLEGRLEGWTPDLFCFGKVAGGGMPLAALAGPSAILDSLAPIGPVYQAGTLSGNPLAVAAGTVTLTRADSEIYDHINSVANQLADITTNRLTQGGIPHRLQRAGSLMSVFWGEEPAQAPVRNYAQALQQDTTMFTRFFHSMLDQGILLPPSAFEAWFLSAAHGQGELDRLDEAMAIACQAVRRGP